MPYSWFYQAIWLQGVDGLRSISPAQYRRTRKNGGHFRGEEIKLDAACATNGRLNFIVTQQSWRELSHDYDHQSSMYDLRGRVKPLRDEVQLLAHVRGLLGMLVPQARQERCEVTGSSESVRVLVSKAFPYRFEVDPRLGGISCRGVRGGVLGGGPQRESPGGRAAHSRATRAPAKSGGEHGLERGLLV